ncbi:hypothetical protein N7G274_009148 [Stereocaulon virgatum]|uniref:Uncharacterized protein n=1 Tax=Stereocaulon virgatum TaxID=373712 RepID=A0ABR3ZYB8_9LECA
MFIIFKEYQQQQNGLQRRQYIIQASDQVLWQYYDSILRAMSMYLDEDISTSSTPVVGIEEPFSVGVQVSCARRQ